MSKGSRHGSLKKRREREESVKEIFSLVSDLPISEGHSSIFLGGND
jgi:hypothetical protein